jgi:hypothetical protein
MEIDGWSPLAPKKKQGLRRDRAARGCANGGVSTALVEQLAHLCDLLGLIPGMHEDEALPPLLL